MINNVMVNQHLQFLMSPKSMAGPVTEMEAGERYLLILLNHWAMVKYATPGVRLHADGRFIKEK